MKNLLHKIGAHFIAFLRKMYYKKRRKALIKDTPTIICNNCFGSFIYHNLGLMFRSPTIDLAIPPKDFFAFVQNLEGYLRAELTEVPDASKEFPVGQLEYNGERVTINFIHYDTFDIAKQKWDQRKGRVDFSNVYIIFQTIGVTDSIVHAFESLPYKNKLLIAKDNPTNSEIVQTLDVLAKPDYRYGEILEYKSPFSLQRYMDAIDYVSFLNRKGDL